MQEARRDVKLMAAVCQRQESLDSSRRGGLKARSLPGVGDNTSGAKGRTSMGRMTTGSGRWWTLALLCAATAARSASAIYLDEEQHVSLRTRMYSQAAIRTEGSFGDTTPTVEAGRLVQHRNFYNPELEAKLTSYTSWMKDIPGLAVVAPDSLDFRLAAWGFYDGLYDYGTQQFDRARRHLLSRFSEATSLDQVLRGTDDVLDARDVYTHQQRVNELYLSYSKGPLFVRLGKQAISWGESDTIALLDQNNPFDLTLGAPGIFEDLDESRIPLWTVRASYTLFDTLGPFSSGFVEAYWVPGDLDTTTANPSLPLTVSPYAPPQKDPGETIKRQLGSLIPGGVNTVLVDHVPAPKMGSSRYGVRVQTVVARDYTVSAWFYTHFPNAPVPRLVGLARPAPGEPQVFAIELVHELVPVFGLSNTFFFQPLNGIIRMEAEYFNREPAFIPGANLLIPQITTSPNLLLKACKTPKGAPIACVGQFGEGGHVPHASFLRWELGYDRFFFFRPLNPSNSFTWVTALVGSYNMDETSKKDFRFAGQQKPGRAGTTPDDFVQLQTVDNAFIQTHLQTDYLHGRLTPQLTAIVNRLGTWALPIQLTYRWSDWLIFDVYYTSIGGAFSGLGFFRDRDQVAARVTYQLN